MPKKKTTKRKPKHVPEYFSPGGHSDQIKCSCGWKSAGYWDLVEAAWDEWLVHAYKTKTPVEEKYHAAQERAVKFYAEHEARQAFRKQLRQRLSR